jgi:DNA-binding CsgD family transcriptional regulator
MMATRRTGERLTLSDIYETYFDGDFELCLKRCCAFQSRGAKDTAELVLLRARCLIHLGRGDQSIEALRGLRVTDEQHDEYLIGRMLMSAAYVSLGRLDDGLKIGQEAYDQIGEDAHQNVRSEVTLNLGIAHYRKGQYAATSRLLDLIPETEDIIYVRTLQFRGGVAWSTGKFETSLDFFRGALALLDHCRHRDRFTESKLLYALAYLSAELPRLDLWPEVSKRIEEFDWCVSGVAPYHYLTSMASSIVTELLGDIDGTLGWVSEAEEVAPDMPSSVSVWCRMADCLGLYGEKRGHSYFTKKALREYDAIPKDTARSTPLYQSLDVAEQVLYSNAPLQASRLVNYYADVVAPTIMSAGSAGRTLEARYAFVLGQLEDQNRNRARAERAYRHAFEIYCSAGLLRVASTVAYRLFALTNDDEYKAFIEQALSSVSEAYWVKANLSRGRTVARLTSRQLEVVRLVAQGLTNKEIGAALKITEARVRNILVVVFRTLGVQSRAELATIATERGLMKETTSHVRATSPAASKK